MLKLEGTIDWVLVLNYYTHVEMFVKTGKC